MEEWKVFEYAPEYKVSSYGRVMRNGKILSGTVNNRGYVRFDLCKNGKRFVVSGHRIVASLFIPKEYGKELINHIDGNKQNNHVENLEWCTPKENTVHAFRNLGINVSNMRQVKQIDIETGNVVCVYKSISDATNALGISIKSGGHISQVCQNKRKVAFGYRWEYANVAQQARATDL